MKRSLIIFILLCFSLSFCSQAISAAYDPDLMKNGIQFVPPEGWEKLGIGQFDGGVKTVSFRNSEKKALISVALPIKTNSIHFQITLMLWRWKIKPKVEKKVKLYGETCYIFDSEKISSKDIKMSDRTYFFKKKNRLYEIAFYAPSNEFENILPEFKKALESFIIVE